MKKPVLFLKCASILIILLFMVEKPNSMQPFHSAKFTGEALASQLDDKQVYAINIKELEKSIQSQITKDGNNINGFPLEILHLYGKKVKLTGYLLIPYDAYLSDNALDNFALGKNAYGCPCCNWGSNPPPTIFNVVFINMKDGQKLKPPFTPLIEVTGTFYPHQEYCTDDQGKKELVGLFFIQDAEARKKRNVF